MSQNIKAFRLLFFAFISFSLFFPFLSSTLLEVPFFAFATPEIDSTKIADNLLAMRQTKKHSRDKNERN